MAQNHDTTYAGDRFFSTPSASVDGHLDFAVKLSLDYGHRPLRIIDKQTGEVVPNGVLLRNQLYMNLDASFTLYEHIKIAVGLPVAVYQSGERMSGSQALKTTAFSDIRAGVRVAFLGTEKDGFSLGLQADVWFPVGSRENFAGDDDFCGHPRLILSGLVGDHFAYSAAVGAMIRRHHLLRLVEVGSAVTYSAAAAYLGFDKRLQIGLEFFGSTTPSSGNSPIGARMCLSSVTFGLGVGTALTDAPGAAVFRGLANVDWSPGRTCGVTDSDGDGIPDKSDACLAERGIETDNPKTHGCSDRDGDGIPDMVDACPEEAGVYRGDPRTDGCPDTDGDGIVGKFDACPEEKGHYSEDPRKNGCPALAVLRKKSVVILKQVQFDFGKATIRPVSNKLLAKVAQILEDYPEIQLLAVDGHTDNCGSHAINMKLSQNRADAVRGWLVKEGKIAPSRRLANGYGPGRPIGTNTTDEGCQANRRVEFNLVSRAEQAEEAPAAQPWLREGGR